MKVTRIPAGSGDWPDYKTPKVKSRGMDVHQCDRCEKDATHVVGEYEVGEPHRFCCTHYAEHRDWIEGAVVRIGAMRAEVRGYLIEHFPEFAAIYC